MCELGALHTRVALLGELTVARGHYSYSGLQIGATLRFDPGTQDLSRLLKKMWEASPDADRSTRLCNPSASGDASHSVAAPESAPEKRGAE